MVEKNTLSILETIKKKLNKFDEKTEDKSKDSDLDREFDYTSTIEAETPANFSAKKIEQDDALNFDKLEPSNASNDSFLDFRQTSDSLFQSETKNEKSELDNFDFGDLDLDDETKIKKSSLPKQKSFATTSKVDFIDDLSEDSIEEYEDDADFEDVAGSSNLDLKNNFEEDEQDVDHSDLQLETNLEGKNFQPKKNEMPNPENDLDFDDLDFEEEQIKNQDKQLEGEFESEIDDLELQDQNLDDFEKRLSSPPEQAQEKLLSDEIDFEFEKEIMGFKPEPERVKKKEAQQSEFQKPYQQKDLQEQAPIQNQITFMNQPKNSGGMIHESTILQTSESIKKLIDAKNVVTGISVFSQSPAFAEIAVQLMEPKLEKWLNDNLPNLVEAIVREEIKKIIPKE